MPLGDYVVWARVKGTGHWLFGTNNYPVQVEDWEWVKMGKVNINGSEGLFAVTSSDDGLKLDMVLFTTEGFIPEASYPADGNPPENVKGVRAIVRGNQVNLLWEPSIAADLHHYTVYCGSFAEFKCTNETVIRSVLKTSITDVLPEKPKGLFYKIIAVDNRWNESQPAIIQLN
jgi:hypothetical protein